LYFTIFVFNIPKNEVIIRFYRQKQDLVVKQLLKFYILCFIYCTVSSIKNLRPDDGLNEERPRHVVD
jgi:hypothetical protein